MRESQLVKGRTYIAIVSDRRVTVRLDDIRYVKRFAGRGWRDVAVFDVTNLRTGRKLTFKSSRRFHAPHSPTEETVL